MKIFAIVAAIIVAAHSKWVEVPAEVPDNDYDLELPSEKRDSNDFPLDRYHRNPHYTCTVKREEENLCEDPYYDYFPCFIYHKECIHGERSLKTHANDTSRCYQRITGSERCVTKTRMITALQKKKGTLWYYHIATKEFEQRMGCDCHEMFSNA